MTDDRILRTTAFMELKADVIACRACPRLVAWREQVAVSKRKAYANAAYWGKPVPGFGDPNAWLAIVGLAPGAHGANRTGRVFTGDRSGDFLFSALHRMGLANQATSQNLDDGLKLSGVYIFCPVRCAPPDNTPAKVELDRCAPFMRRELDLLTETKVFLTLGGVAFSRVRNMLAPQSRLPFAHGETLELTDKRRIVASYHVSQQNTQTGRLTASMFDEILVKAAVCAGVSELV